MSKKKTSSCPWNGSDLVGFAAAEESQANSFLSKYTTEINDKDSVPVRVPPTVRFPKKGVKAIPPAPPLQTIQAKVVTPKKKVAVPKKFKAGEWAESLNARLYQWLADEGKTVAEHSPSLPLAYFDEFGTFDRRDTPDFISALETLSQEGGYLKASVLDTHPPQPIIAALCEKDYVSDASSTNVGIWRPARLTYFDGTLFEGAWLDGSEDEMENPFFKEPPMIVALEPTTTGEEDLDWASRRLHTALSKRRDAEALIRYKLFVDCVPLNLRTVSPLTDVMCDALMKRACSTPKTGGALTTLRELADELLREVKGEHISAMNKIAFDTNAHAPQNKKLLTSLKLPPTLPPPPPPVLGTIVMPPSYRISVAASKFSAISLVTTPTVLDVLRAARTVNSNASTRRLLFTGPPPTLPKGGRKGSALAMAMEFDSSVHGNSSIGGSSINGDGQAEEEEEDDLEMDGVWTYQSFMAKQESHIKKMAIRTIKEDWPHDMGSVIHTALAPEAEGSEYNVNETFMERYMGPECFKLKGLLERINLEMQDVMRELVRNSLKEYVEMLELPALDKADPCLGLRMRVSKELTVLNHVEVAEAEAQREEWQAARQAKIDMKKPVNEKEVCPVAQVEKIMGHVFEYNVQPKKYMDNATQFFDSGVSAVQGIFQVARFVMQRLFFARPQIVDVPNGNTDWVKEFRKRLVEALENSLSEPASYLATMDEFKDFVNLDIDEYLSKLDFKLEAHDEGSHMPRVDIAKLEKVLAEHATARDAILNKLPETYVKLGVWAVDVSPVRNALERKHSSIIHQLLLNHSEAACELALAIDCEYLKLEALLAEKPTNIEATSQLEEFLSHVEDQTKPLEDLIEECDSYTTEILDRFYFQVDVEKSHARFRAQGWPHKVRVLVESAKLRCVRCREQFAEELVAATEIFRRSVATLEQDVVEFCSFDALQQVEEANEQGEVLAKRLQEAESTVMLFNNREGLFEVEMTEYEELNRAKRMFEPYNNLWKSTGTWLDKKTQWMDGPFSEIDAEHCEDIVENTLGTISKTFKFFSQGSNISAKHANIAKHVQGQVKDFRPLVPLIVALRNRGMADRHWAQIEEATGITIGDVNDHSFTLQKVCDLDLDKHLETCEKIAETAAKEYTIEQTLDKMEEDWVPFKLDIRNYRDTGTGVLAGFDEINTVLDEQVTMTQAMQFSAFKGPFEERIDVWNHKLFVVSEVLDNWVKVQREWMYLQPIFESEDIIRQLPVEAKKYAHVDKAWRQTISGARKHPEVIEYCDNEKLLHRFREGVKMLDEVQKGLNQYLETKRDVFPRFYFLSNDDLLTILSESKDVMKLQPHFKKVFEATDHVIFDEELNITSVVSPEKERFELTNGLDPKGHNVESWLFMLEGEMRLSVRDIMKAAIADYMVVSRIEWMQKWPSMHVLNGSQLYWTKETEELFAEHGAGAPQIALDLQKKQLADMVLLVRQPLPKGDKTKVGALAVIDVHARDVMVKLVNAGTETTGDFLWQSQLRYYWEIDGSEHEDGDLWAMMVAARRPYGYEYLGNSFRLVITPLTDKCYLTLMGALQMILGGAPAGPAGTGKTETTKDLSKALAVQCVVFNCSDGLGYLEMGKFAKGLSSCGAWACYDEFNRINIEVLSVVGQQVMEIQLAIKAGLKRIVFMESDIAVKTGFGVFITMNPGYAGRTELPDSLSALFRPVAMMVPDYALIGEIMFFAYGFGIARECGAKMVTTFKLCSEQCSSQPHYDYGMRAVKTVIVAAGNLKQAEPDSDELTLLMRALQDVNVPKFLDQDIPLFAGIMSDLFPGIIRPELAYGDLFASMKKSIAKRGLQPHPWFIEKVIQLYEMIVVRHGLMVVGPTGGGKTENIHVLKNSLGDLKKQGKTGFAYEKVIIYQLNPKSITMGQMYGAFDPNTREWQDGIMSTMYRHASMSPTSDRKWMMFNGPVDAIWIENMNTVLDDNKKLCLNSGEIMKMSDEMTMMFEVEDLQVASPATVSRVGIIYMEPSALGIDVLVQSWIEKLPEVFPTSFSIRILFLMDAFLRPGITFVRDHLKELSPTVDNNMTSSLMRLLDCFFEPFRPVEGRPPVAQSAVDAFAKQIDDLFLFCMVWTVGATTNEDGRKRFDSFLRGELAMNGMKKPPADLYSCLFDTDTGKWVKWMETQDPFDLSGSKLSFSEIVVPTTDSVRNTFLLDTLVSNNMHTLMVGETGTGKTINISQYLQGQSKSRGKTIDPSIISLSLTFSATASANMTQDMLDSKFDKRKRGVFGPPAGKRYAIHMDDMNMPLRETYGAQPPIEILRQWFDQEGWYDRKELTFRKIVDITLVGSMGPAGGGRQMVTPRFLRHFNTIGYVEMSDESKYTIFSTILNNWLQSFPNNTNSFLSLSEPLVHATLNTFNSVIAELLPTPAKCHYIFNLRDLSKVFQGVLMGEPKTMTEPIQLVRLWLHECKRVFEDRMINDQDHEWFTDLMSKQLTEGFKMNWADVNPNERLIYGDFMVPTSDAKLYDEISDMALLKHTVEEYLADHNSESKQPMPLVMFADALEHVSRISRVIRQPQGNALLLGVGGSGRQSMTRLATYISGYRLFNVNITKGYGQNEWREDLKTCLLFAGVQDKPIVFLFSDAQVVMESMVEDLNNILNAGDVPNLYNAEDEDAIVQACRVECQRKRIPPTKLNIFAQYLIRVRRNLHVCFCMSPIGDAFRNRLRNFPSIVNCCTSDWFTLWPKDALISVASAILDTSDMQTVLKENLNPMVEMFGNIHLSVEEASKQFYDTLRRRNYVTPTSFLELLSSFKSLLMFKQNQVNTKRERLQAGLDKLSSTKEVVSTLQKEIEALAPVLVTKSKEVSEMMVVITKDKGDAEVIKAKCEIEEASANEKAAATKEIADSAQADLDKALPALAAAVKSLDALKKSDIDEVKALGKPPNGVRLTMEVCCLMFEVKPDIIKDPESGKKVPDYFGTSKKTLLTDARGFMDQMIKFDKDNIKDSVIKKIAPFMDDPDFTPDAIKKASVACTAICMWAHAMNTYHYVALGVAPKKAKLKEAQAVLDKVLASLAEAKSKLGEVVNKVASLERQFDAAMAEKAELEAKASQCQTRLANATKLIGGLGGEETRWKDTVGHLNDALVCVPGDVAVSAGTVSYLAPFTSDYRSRITAAWRARLSELKIPSTEGCDIEQTLVDPIKLRKWQLCALPSDPLSTQNGIIMDTARRWPLVLDPQGQANTYIKRMGKNKELALSGLDVVKMSEKNFLRSLENGVRFGKWVLLENIGESLDASLEPILMQQVFKQGGQDVIKIGDNTIPYSDTFKFFMTTKMPNPHYPPEVQVKVSIVNFTVTPVGLEDQLLNICVGEELPDLAEKKSELVIANANMNMQLYDIESQILFLLSNSTGNILDDTVLIETLSQAKTTSDMVKAKMAEAEETGKEIFARSEEYRVVGFRASLLYFCIASLSDVDPMYQYSLQWYTSLFCKGIAEAPQASEIVERCDNIIEHYTYMLYCNVCRSLFEEHKLMFSLLACIAILQGDKKVDTLCWRFLISGMSLSKHDAPNPDPSWIESNVWDEVCNLTGGIPFFAQLADSFRDNTKEWQEVFDDNQPHLKRFPKPFELLTMDDPEMGLKRMCIVRCVRLDKTMDAVQAFVMHQDCMGRKFVEPPPMNLKECYNDSSVIMPLIFILSTGSDPNKDIQMLAENMGCSESLKSIALGQGQGKLAETLIEKGMEKGDWVVLQNCHLFVSWMPTLEAICEEMEADKIHPDFRLWLTSKPSAAFPMTVLQNGVKMTKEPPKGLRANLRSMYVRMTDSDVSRTSKPEQFAKLLFGLCFFHATVIERKRYGPLGWNIPYAFNDTDLDITISQLELYIDKYEEIPYSVLQLLTSMVNYGGRITDDKDMRTSDIIVSSLLSANVLIPEFGFSRSGVYKSIHPDANMRHKSYMDYIDQLPLNAEPEVFGMHENAAITCDINEVVETFGIVVSLQPRSTTGGGISREDQIGNIAAELESQMIPAWDEEKVKLSFPIDYNESMNTILGQEIAKYNRLVKRLRETLSSLQLALKGLVVLSADLEAMGNSLFDQQVPDLWMDVGYPSLKPLNAWFSDFLKRTVGFMQKWIDKGIPASFWISGFFFPQGFLTAILQNYARKNHMPIDTVSFSVAFLDKEVESLTQKPEAGAYTYGLFLEGARWDKEAHVIDDPRPKELFSPVPVIHKIPEQYRKTPQSGIYRCPVYKILSRRGVLSTTGHSTNFVLWLEVPSDKPVCFRSSLVSETNMQVQYCDNEYWVKGGVAAFCSLRY